MRQDLLGGQVKPIRNEWAYENHVKYLGLSWGVKTAQKGARQEGVTYECGH